VKVSPKRIFFPIYQKHTRQLMNTTTALSTQQLLRLLQPTSTRYNPPPPPTPHPTWSSAASARRLSDSMVCRAALASPCMSRSRVPPRSSAEAASCRHRSASCSTCTCSHSYVHTYGHACQEMGGASKWCTISQTLAT